MTTSTATRFGWSYLSTYAACPMRWFNRYLRPHPEGGIGREARTTSDALLLGSIVHSGLECYYGPGARDPDVAALAVAEAARDRAHELEDSKDALKLANQGIALLHGYHTFWEGDPSLEPLRILNEVDQLELLVEREFELDLGKGRLFTTRPDLIALYNGRIWGVEHKTSAASAVWRLVAQAHLSGQFTGEYLAIEAMARTFFPQLEFGGILLNVLVKDRAAKSDKPPFLREEIRRTADEVSKFRLDVMRQLDEIDARVEEYEKLRSAGLSIDDAANRVFSATRDVNTCVGFSRCDFYGACKARGFESSILDSGNFRPRSESVPVGVEETSE